MLISVPSSREGGVIAPADLRVLAAVGRFVYLTARQVARRLYAETSLSYVQARLKRLADAGYLERRFLPRPTRSGSAPIVYAVSRQGTRALVECGQSPATALRAAGASYLFFAHTLALNDLLIAIERWCCHQPRLELLEWRHERLLRHQPLVVCLADGRSATVIPDAWINLRVDRRLQICYLVELDRGTTGQAAWRRKVAALLAAASGPYQARFRTRSLTILVLATPGARRRDALLRWTEAELTAQGRGDDADLFRFSGEPASIVTPPDLVQNASWIRPFGGAWQSLAEMSAISESRDLSDIAAMTVSAEESDPYEMAEGGRS